MESLLLPFSLIFLCALVAAALCAIPIRWLARSAGIIDEPSMPRKIHDQAVPLLGGAALFIGFCVAIVFAASSGWLSDTRIPLQMTVAIVAAGAFLMIVGALDDWLHLRWWQQLAGPVGAALLLLLAGLDIPFVTNPFGAGVLDLDTMRVGEYLLPTGQILVFLWIIGMTYTTKLLDGIDGLATSVSAVAAIVLFVVSLSWDRTGSATSFLSLALAGACVGFLIWNWHPAKLFLGEGGSTFLGCMLAVLAILSGGKIATALLVMGVPLLDVFWIIVQRLRARKGLFSGDDKHLHFRLLKAGLTQQQVVALLAFFALAFGSVSFFFTTQVKLIALAILVIIVSGLEWFIARFNARSSHP